MAERTITAERQEVRMSELWNAAHLPDLPDGR